MTSPCLLFQKATQKYALPKWRSNPKNTCPRKQERSKAKKEGNFPGQQLGSRPGDQQIQGGKGGGGGLWGKRLQKRPQDKTGRFKKKKKKNKTFKGNGSSWGKMWGLKKRKQTEKQTKTITLGKLKIMQ